MDTTIGAGQTSLANTSTNVATLVDYYVARWVSPLLDQTSVSANTWTYNFATNESNTNANFPVSGTNQPVYVNCYVWKPSNGTKYGTILDGNTESTVDETGTGELARHVTFSGSAVSSLTAGDAVIVFEAWFRVTQAMATAYTQTFYYDGTTENTTDNASVSNHASFIETPENITFDSGLERITKDLILKWNMLHRMRNFALTFDGTNDNVDCGNHTDLWSQGLTKFSMAVWIYPTAGWDGNDRTFITHGSASNHGFGCFVDTSVANRVRFQIKNSVGSILTASSDSLQLNKWNHIICTYDNTLGSANIKIYVDTTVGGTTGNLTETINLSATLNLSQNTTDFQGNMKDFRFWDSIILDSTQRTDVFNNSDSAPAADYWLPMTEGTSTPVDRIAGKTTTLSGPTWVNESPVVWCYKPLTLKWNTIGRITKALTLKWNIIGRITKALTLKWDIAEGLERITKDLTLKWNIQERITKALTLKWNIQQRITKALTLKWNIQERITKALTLKWNIIGRITKDLILKWNIIGRITKALTLKWHIQERITKNLTLKWNLLNFITKSLILKWHIQERITKALTLKWNIIGRITKALTLKWNIIGRITKDTILKWNIIGRITKAVTLKWNIVGRITKNLTLKWDILEGDLERVTKNLTLKWNIVGRITKNIILKWHITNLVTKSLTLKWNILNFVTKSVTLKWHIQQRITKALTLKWHIQERITKSLTLKWNTIGRIVKNLTLKWNITNLVTKTLTLKWNIQQRITKTLTLKWNIQQRITKNLTLIWNITSDNLVRITKTLTLRWVIDVITTTRDFTITGRTEGRKQPSIDFDKWRSYLHRPQKNPTKKKSRFTTG